MSQLRDIGYPYDSNVTFNELLKCCSHYDVLTMNGACFSYSFLILLWNSRSFSKKFDEFNTVLNGFICKPTIICLSETLYMFDVPIFPLNGYNVVNVPRISWGGGVCIYVQKSHVYSTHTPVQATTFEYAMITMQHLNPFSIIIVCKPPSSAILIFLEKLDLLLTAVSKQFPHHELYLSGDFNINLLISDCSGFGNSLLACNLYPTNIYPTHFLQALLR